MIDLVTSRDRGNPYLSIYLSMTQECLLVLPEKELEGSGSVYIRSLPVYMSVRERTELEVLEKQPEDPSVGGELRKKIAISSCRRVQHRGRGCYNV